MDISNPWILMSGLVIGLIGVALFTYGKKQQDVPTLFSGLALCVYPCFISSVLLVWAIFAGIIGALYAIKRA